MLQSERIVEGMNGMSERGRKGRIDGKEIRKCGNHLLDISKK